MASVTISPPTTNKHLIRWVEKMADLTQPTAFIGSTALRPSMTFSATS